MKMFESKINKRNDKPVWQRPSTSRFMFLFYFQMSSAPLLSLREKHIDDTYMQEHWVQHTHVKSRSLNFFESHADAKWPGRSWVGAPITNIAMPFSKRNNGSRMLNMCCQISCFSFFFTRIIRMISRLCLVKMPRRYEYCLENNKNTAPLCRRFVSKALCK